MSLPSHIIMTFEEAKSIKELKFSKRDITGKLIDPNIYIVPHHHSNFHPYLKFINQMDWNELSDETAIEFSTDGYFIHASLRKHKEGVFYRRFFFEEDGKVELKSVEGQFPKLDY